jgi:hypothetical protein
VGCKWWAYPDNFAPYNSQNTAIARKLLPLNYLFRNLPARRFDDILSSYVAQAVFKHHGYTQVYGQPLAKQ